MNGHMCMAVNSKCYNFYESYGGTCVRCNCCSPDKLERSKARLALHKRMLEDDEHFSNWFYDCPELMKLQEENVKKNIAWDKKKIATYEAKVKKYTEPPINELNVTIENDGTYEVRE